MTDIEVRVLGPGDAAVLASVAAGTFDEDIDPSATRAYLDDARNYLVVALDGETVVGFASAVEHTHPDKPRPQLWVNEVGVADAYRRRGIASAVFRKLLEVARERGVDEAWVTTESDNGPALGLYRALGGEQAAGGVEMFTFRLE